MYDFNEKTILKVSLDGIGFKLQDALFVDYALNYTVYLVQPKRLFSVVTFRHQRETFCLITVLYIAHCITNLHLNCLKHNECTRSREHSQVSRGDVDLLSKTYLNFVLSPPSQFVSVCRGQRLKAGEWRPERDA